MRSRWLAPRSWTGGRIPSSAPRPRSTTSSSTRCPGAGLGKVAEVSRITFLRSLPPDDELPITTANLTDDPTLAAYLQVTVKPVGMAMIFPISLSPGRRTISVGAQAVAGYDQIVCNAAPVFVCNPYETPGMTYFQATQALIAADQASAPHSRLIRLARSQFKNGGYSAGDFGYVQPATGYLPENACGPVGEGGIPAGAGGDPGSSLLSAQRRPPGAKRRPARHGRPEHPFRSLRQRLL